jgi:ADP-ribosylation factor protein 1
MSLTALPKDLMQLLALQLPPQDIARLGLTCKSLARVLLSLEAEPLWQRVAERQAGGGAEKRLATWRETVAELCAMWSFDNLPTFAPRDKTSFGAKLKSLLTRPRPLLRVAVIGMPKSGKSSFIHKLVMGEFLPAEQLGVRRRGLVPFKKLDFGLVEGDAATLRQSQWNGLAAVILVVDCSDREAFPGAKSLASLVVERCQASLLVMANKQDLPNSATVAETATSMELHTMRNRKWFIQGACAKSG